MTTPPSQREGGNVRVKDVEKIYSKHFKDFSPEIQGFITDYYDMTGRIFNITSGKRDSSPSGRFSHHHKGDAFDIKASHKEDYELLYNTREGLELLSKYGLGIIDETTPEMLTETKGTEAHYRIGKDSKFREDVNKRLETMFPPNLEAKKQEIEAETEIQKQAEKEVLAQTNNEVEEERKELTEANQEETDKINLELEFLKEINKTNQQADLSDIYQAVDREEDIVYSNLQSEPLQQGFQNLNNIFL